MAARTILVDDIDASETQVTTTSFSLDGRDYEIDLSAKHLAALQKAFAPYIEKGRLTGSKTVRKSGSQSKASRRDLPEIREWAKRNGHTIAERGRVPKDLIALYDAAHASRAA